MAVLMHLDSPVEFSVYVGGDVRARIVKEGMSWLLRPLDRPRDVLDVTSLINRHDQLAPRVLAHLAQPQTTGAAD